MWSLSHDAQNALAGSFVMDVRCTVYSPVYGVLDNLPVAGGVVNADATSQVRRTGTLQADPRYWPRRPGELLSPFGSAVQIDYGIGLPSGDFEYVPLGYLSIDETSRDRPVSGSADIEVKLVDLSARVAEDRFEAPEQTLSGATVVSEIRRFIKDTLGNSIEFFDLTGSLQVAPVMEIERNRWPDGIEKLSDSIGAETFFDQRGRPVVRPQPTLDDPPVWKIYTGNGGNLLVVNDKQTREQVYNKIVFSGSRSDGTDPVYGVAVDTDPNSPTRWAGPFGRKSRFYTSPLMTTEDQCEAAAEAQLERARGVSASISMKITPNPALEPGDVVNNEDEELGTSVQILDKVATPLTPEDMQELGTRADILPAES